MTEKYLDNFIVYQNTVLQSFLKPFYFGQDSFFCSETDQAQSGDGRTKGGEEGGVGVAEGETGEI